MRECFEVIQLACILIVVVVKQIYTIFKNFFKSIISPAGAAQWLSVGP